MSALHNPRYLWLAWPYITQKTTGQSEERFMYIRTNQPFLRRAPERGAVKICKDVFWYLYQKYIFLRTSKPKIKLQKGVQYKIFNITLTFRCNQFQLYFWVILTYPVLQCSWINQYLMCKEQCGHQDGRRNSADTEMLKKMWSHEHRSTCSFYLRCLFLLHPSLTSSTPLRGSLSLSSSFTL